MSTKTTFKRIALVAVAALGFGMISVAPSSAATTALTVSGIARAGVGLQLSVASDDATDSTSYVHYVTTGALPTGGAVATGYGTQLADGEAVIAIADDGSNDFVAGTYNLLVWVNSTSTTQAAPGVSDISARVAVTVAGAPAKATLTAPTTSTPKYSKTNAEFVASVQDANGVETLLGTNETLTVTATYSVGTLKIASATDSTGSTLSTGATNKVALSSSNAVADNSDLTNNWTFYLGNSEATATTVAIGGAGLLAGITGASATFTTVTKNYPSAIDVSGGSTYSSTAKTAGVTASGTYTHATQVTAAGTTALLASTVDAKSVTFRLTGTATHVFPVVVAAKSTTTALPAGVTAGTYSTSVATGDTYVDYTITSTAPVAGSGYKVTIALSATDDAVFTVTYEAPTVSSSKGSITLSPASGDAAKALIGSSVTVAATVKDQFGKAFAGANVVFSANTRNALNAAANVVSSATGSASYTYTDIKTTAGSETFSVTATAPSASAGVSASTTVAFGTAATVTVSTLTLTSDKHVATTGDAVDAAVTETAVVRNADGAPLAGIPVTFTLTSGLYTAATSLVAYSNTSGEATLVVYGKTTGAQTVTASVGAVTASDVITVVTATSKSRTISLSSSDVLIDGAKTVKVTVSVKDGYGNGVPGHSLTVSYVGTAGRVSAIGGIVSATATTGLDGTVVVDIAGNGSEEGTGTLTVTGTMGDSSTSAVMSDAVTARPAKTASTGVSAKVTINSGADIAADAAAEATDAANAATDAANAAAEAADAATAAAQDAADAVAALSTQVTEMVSALKKQITALTNLVIKIQKKVKA